MKKNKKIFLFSLLSLMMILSITYWIYRQFIVSTDNAYVNGYVVHIAPRVTGRVAHLYVKNNQHVKAGEVLFELDPEMFLTAVEQAKANLAIAQAKYKMAVLTENRMESLVKKKVVSAQEGDVAETDLEAARANILLSRSNLSSAELNLKYTKVTSPSDGWITNLSLREGENLLANQTIFMLVNDQEFWVDANLKETELQYIRMGQTAIITLDMYPKYHLKGVVESISNGSGSAFSIFPAENATGNWVKVTQRIPVKVRIIPEDQHFQLRLGASANVKIHINPWKKV